LIIYLHPSYSIPTRPHYRPRTLIIDSSILISRQAPHINAPKIPLPNHSTNAQTPPRGPTQLNEAVHATKLQRDEARRRGGASLTAKPSSPVSRGPRPRRSFRRRGGSNEAFFVEVPAARSWKGRWWRRWWESEPRGEEAMELELGFFPGIIVWR
jgi:hypothetical protein